MRSLFVAAAAGAALLATPTAAAPSLAGRSIYFAMLDRFARAPSNTNETVCDGDYRWCGGTLSGLTSRIDYIASMGFDCVWITPVVKQPDGEFCHVDRIDGNTYCLTGYHGYWAQDWYAIDEHLGTSADLQALSSALHARSMCLVLDIVVNHVRPLHSSADVATVNPFNSTADYHTLNATVGESFDSYVRHPASAFPGGGCRLGELTCAGYNDTFVKEGWFADLGDLAQERPTVWPRLLQWARHMVHTYQIDALRLDTAAYVPTSFLASLQAAVGVDILGEVTTTNVSFHAAYQQSLSGILNFPIYYALPDAFCPPADPPADMPADMRLLARVLRAQGGDCDSPYADLDLLGTFVDNHDPPSDRIGLMCGGDASRIAHVLTFVMLWRGVPIIYYGTEQGFAQADRRTSLWQTAYNRDHPTYTLLRALNGVRRAQPAITRAAATVLHADEHTLVFARGELAYAFLNNANQSAATEPRTYCLESSASLPPQPPAGSEWVDALSGRAAHFDRARGCLLAPDSSPQVIVLRARQPAPLPLPAPPPPAPPSPPSPVPVASPPPPPPPIASPSPCTVLAGCKATCVTDFQTCKSSGGKKMRKQCKKTRKQCKKDCAAAPRCQSCEDNTISGFGTFWCEMNAPTAGFCAGSQGEEKCKKTCGLCR